MANINVDAKPVATNESGVLAGLWRKILHENGLVNNIDYLVNKYVSRVKGVSSSKTEKFKSRSTIVADITARDMTIKTFLYLIFNFLQARNVVITIDITFPNGETRTHSLPISYNKESNSEEVIEKTEDKENENGRVEKEDK